MDRKKDTLRDSSAVLAVQSFRKFWRIYTLCEDEMTKLLPQS